MMCGKFGSVCVCRLAKWVYDTGPALSSLRSLSVSGNNLEVIPDPVWTLTQLEELDLSGNRLRDLPDDLAQLTNLKRLDVSNNKLAGRPAVLDRLPSTVAVVIGGNPCDTGATDEGGRHTHSTSTPPQSAGGDAPPRGRAYTGGGTRCRPVDCAPASTSVPLRRGGGVTGAHLGMWPQPRPSATSAGKRGPCGAAAVAAASAEPWACAVACGPRHGAPPRRHRARAARRSSSSRGQPRGGLRPPMLCGPRGRLPLLLGRRRSTSAPRPGWPPQGCPGPAAAAPAPPSAQTAP
eukprot:CAMPEP_0206332574 /NCGR_PEP_ID=MMETSP0106_2-20121207/24837_1 /ASSEMBLY_ACC=CAM_ASM_000206 /TAXON_ID=81532 /ORGANISM="Acanthoeca-like sp., Strain 10tr" /LENGTH=291 /DNA_ID=CAMNT_0053765433 /DNA_START=13 /DNA_END=889 /DNA_ORIENTATION=+